MEVGDGLLVGAAEGGFCGLEEFTPTEGMIQEWTSAAASPDSAIGLPGKSTSRPAVACFSWLVRNCRNLFKACGGLWSYLHTIPIGCTTYFMGVH